MVHQINLGNQMFTVRHLGEDEMILTKEYYKWTFEEDFHVPEEVYATFKEAAEKLGGAK